MKFEMQIVLKTPQKEVTAKHIILFALTKLYMSAILHGQKCS